MAAGVLTGDPVAGLKMLSGEDGTQLKLEGLSDLELRRKASREMLIAIRLVSDVLRSQLPDLVATKTMETATLLNASIRASGQRWTASSNSTICRGRQVMPPKIRNKSHDIAGPRRNSLPIVPSHCRRKCWQERK